MTALNRNPQNTSPLQASKFQLLFPRISTVTYFCQKVNIPGISTTAPYQPTPFANIPRAGDKLVFSEFSVDFIVDEEMWNWQVMYDWIRGLTFPCSFEEYKNLNRQSIYTLNSERPQDSDGYLTILSGINVPKLKINFENVFPISLSDIWMDTTTSAENVVVVTATFKYHIYNIERL
jgi:hypothetical protein